MSKTDSSSTYVTVGEIKEQLRNYPSLQHNIKRIVQSRTILEVSQSFDPGNFPSSYIHNSRVCFYLLVRRMHASNVCRTMCREKCFSRKSLENTLMPVHQTAFIVH